MEKTILKIMKCKSVLYYIFTCILLTQMLSIPVHGDTKEPSIRVGNEINEAILYNLVPENLQSDYTIAITRAEFCAMGVALYGAVVGNTFKYYWQFDDTDDINVGKMAEINVVRGVRNNKFEPDSLLTREQAAVMLSRLAQYIDMSRIIIHEASYDDKDEISDWAIFDVGKIQATGIMIGINDNYFFPGDPYTREQSISSILGLYKLLVYEYEYFNIDNSQNNYREAMEYYNSVDGKIYRNKIAETDLCSIESGYISMGPHGDTACLRLIYKKGSPLGEGTIVNLPMPYINAFGKKDLPEYFALCEDKFTLYYSFIYDRLMEIKGPDGKIIHRAGTYSYSVNLHTGITTLEIIKTISFNASHGIYESEFDMNRDADLIVIGKIDPKYIINEENSYVEGFMHNRTLGSYYSIAPFIVLKTLKGNKNIELIDLLQPVAITRDPYNRPVKLKIRGYTELTNINYYLLYLKKLEYDELSDISYGISAIYYGRVKLGPLDINNETQKADIFDYYYYDKYDGDIDLVNRVQYIALLRYEEKINEFAFRINQN